MPEIARRKFNKDRDSEVGTEHLRQLGYAAFPKPRKALTTVPVRTRSDGRTLIKKVYRL
jgi:hypothetical protein